MTQNMIECPKCHAHIEVSVVVSADTSPTDPSPDTSKRQARSKSRGTAEDVIEWTRQDPRAGMVPTLSSILYRRYLEWCFEHERPAHSQRGMTTALLADGWTFDRSGEGGARRYRRPTRLMTEAEAAAIARSLQQTTTAAPARTPEPAAAPVSTPEPTPQPASDRRLPSWADVALSLKDPGKIENRDHARIVYAYLYDETTGPNFPAGGMTVDAFRRGMVGWYGPEAANVSNDDILDVVDGADWSHDFPDEVDRITPPEDWSEGWE